MFKNKVNAKRTILQVVARVVATLSTTRVQKQRREISLWLPVVENRLVRTPFYPFLHLQNDDLKPLHYYYLLLFDGRAECRLSVGTGGRGGLDWFPILYRQGIIACSYYEVYYNSTLGYMYCL
jgi:hypothetical protein